MNDIRASSCSNGNMSIVIICCSFMVYRGVKVVSDIDIVKIAAKGIGLKLSLLVFLVDIEISVAVCINIGGFVKQQSLLGCLIWVVNT